MFLLYSSIFNQIIANPNSVLALLENISEKNIRQEDHFISDTSNEYHSCENNLLDLETIKQAKFIKKFQHE